MPEIVQANISYNDGGNDLVAGNSDGSEALHRPSAPLTPHEFLAFFWGLHLFGTDFYAVKRLVGTRQVCESVFSARRLPTF